jgi:DNA-binding NtrC family response regulator
MKAFKKPGTATGFSAGALVALKEFSWPGNVRQLQSAVNHLSASAASPLIEEAQVRRLLGSSEHTPPPASEVQEDMPYKESLERFEAQYVKAVLARAQGNVSEAARLSGLPRRTFYRFLERHPGAKS